MPADTWFITGDGWILGRALCDVLLARGLRVAATAATARDPGTLDELAPTEAGASIAADRWWTGQRDVTDHAEIRHAVDAAFAAFGRIDVIVSNAGYGLFGAAGEVTDALEAQQDLVRSTDLGADRAG